jgi:hypothetical protein
MSIDAPQARHVFLPECETFLTNLSEVARIEQGQVPFQAALMDNGFVSLLFIGSAEQNVILPVDQSVYCT